MNTVRCTCRLGRVVSTPVSVALASMTSLAALIAASGVQAQTAPAGPPQQVPVAGTPDTQTPPAADSADTTGADIVVTGIRQSLEKAAEIKQNAVAVVDSIVAQDIGKLPDPTTAAALQRVPGIQVSVGRTNELGDVRIRGLPDVLTTVNGREIFTTNARRFDLQDLPAEALARVDVYKSQTPDLIEGGLAGVIDLELNKPLNFREPTIVLTTRASYGLRSDKIDPQFGILATERLHTGLGEMGLLVNITQSRLSYERDETILSGLRSSAATPLSTPGYLVPNILQNFPEQGRLRRTQGNVAYQWQITPSLQLYVDGLYTRSRDTGAHYGANIQPYTTGTTISNIQASSNCFQTRATSAGQNPTIMTAQNGTTSLQPFTVQNLCYLTSATFNNLVANQTDQARDNIQTNKQIAGGISFDRDGWKGGIDASYQTSRSATTLVIADVGQRLPSLTMTSDVDGIAQFTVPDDSLLRTDNLYIRNSFQQNFGLIDGHLFAAKVDAEKKFDGILSSIKVGARYADRVADAYSVVLNTAIPNGNIGTATEATAVKVSATGLPANFLSLGSPAPGINGGSRFYVPSPDFLLSSAGQDALRRYVGLPAGRPDFQKSREFDAQERTYAGYAELNYKIPLWGSAYVDGLIGGRYIVTDRTVQTFVASGTGNAVVYTPLAASTTDRDFLPTVTARLKLAGGLQFRLGYTKSIRRPDFTDLNPAVTLSLSNNPFVQSGGSAGNPNLREQKSNSYDATAEYYFRSGYVAVAGYYRQIKDRVISGAGIETYGGVDYSISRPRNLGRATLKGIEVSGQYFLDFLPGALAGVGLQGAFTLADSSIGGGDVLAGYALQGVSKYNYTAGLLYEKYGISGRLIYTYRSSYLDADQTASISVRPIAAADVSRTFVPTLVSIVRPAGRLDFNVGYDVTKAIRVDVGGVNVLRSKTKTYMGNSYEVFQGFYDETTYSVGVRVRL